MQDETKFDGQTGDVTIELKKKREVEERVVRLASKRRNGRGEQELAELEEEKDKFEDTWIGK